MATVMPASWVRSGFGVPNVCSRHGQPATRRHRMVIESSPPGWTYATIPAGLLIFGILRAVFRRAIATPAWPFCDRCRVRRGITIAIASAIVGAGLATAVGGSVSPDDDVVVGMFAAGLAIALLGYVAFHWARRAAVAGARLTRDGHHVLLKRANPAFAAQVHAALAQPTPQRAHPAIEHLGPPRS